MKRRVFFKSIGILSAGTATMHVTAAPYGINHPPETTNDNDPGPPYNRDLQVDISINQVGFLPGARKQCVLLKNESSEFQVIHLDTGFEAFRGSFSPSEKDFGRYATGDFSAVVKPGTYYIKAGNLRSFPFKIQDGVYDPIMQKICSYFSKQRCGPSTTGYLTPCHMDDGVRKDNGEHQDVSGGWHDASDLRKWVGATLYGMIGLSHLMEDLNPSWDHGDVMEELRWGNRYFLNMQEPEGYVMSFIGGNIVEHGDNNRWTNNVIGEEGGELKTVPPGTGRSDDPMTVYGNKDDRVIETEPLGLRGQYDFVIAQARMARLTRQADPAYSQQCLAAAKKCMDWCLNNGPGENAGELGALIESGVELYKTTHDDQYADLGVKYARQLLDLQIREPLSSTEPVQGFFQHSRANDQPYREISRTCYHFIGLCDLLETLPAHAQAPDWRAGIQKYAQEYLARIMQKNHFGIAPFGFYAENNPGGERKIGDYWYRYFMVPGDHWWVGINANLASAGVGMVKASRLLEEPELLQYAQQQLDWILGFNPHNASTMEGVGYNHPEMFLNVNEFHPPNPRIPGAVMNGLGGTPEDQPVKNDGSYNVAEYWTPMVGQTLWLMAELSNEV